MILKLIKSTTLPYFYHIYIEGILYFIVMYLLLVPVDEYNIRFALNNIFENYFNSYNFGRIDFMYNKYNIPSPVAMV